MVVKRKFMLDTEASWSDANKKMLQLDTGGWRTLRPVVDKEKCNYCGLCALFCPPQCMHDKDDHYEVDLAFCKGCGICANECPRKAIEMLPEGDFADEG